PQPRNSSPLPTNVGCAARGVERSVRASSSWSQGRVAALLSRGALSLSHFSGIRAASLTLECLPQIASGADDLAGDPILAGGFERFAQRDHRVGVAAIGCVEVTLGEPDSVEVRMGGIALGEVEGISNRLAGSFALAVADHGV